VELRTKRIYDDPSPDDGYRVLVDRLWPRGVSKERAALGEWAKEVAPSDELRTWFHHEVQNWPEFERRYRAELDQNRAAAELRASLAGHRVVTLLYSAKDERHNQALVLADWLG
jgi:uncharacterized protein YeaO (DUF488 family)